MASLRIVHLVVFTVSVLAASLQFNVVISAPSEEPEPEPWTAGQMTLRPRGRYFIEPFNQPYCQCVSPSERALARFPNRRNQFAKEAEKEFGDFTRRNRNVIENGCSNKIGTLLCFFYFPLNVVFPEVLPCRELCEEVRRDCERQFSDNGFPWPEHLDCTRDYFRPTGHGLCVNGTDPDQGYDACMHQATVEPPKTTREPPGAGKDGDTDGGDNSTMSGSGKEEAESGSCVGECATDSSVTDATSGPRGNTSTPQPATVTTSTPSTDSTTPVPLVTTVSPVTTESICDPTQCPSCSRLRTNCNGGTFVRNSYTWAAQVRVLRPTTVNSNKAYLVDVLRQYLPDPEQAEEMEQLTIVQTTNPKCCGDCPADIVSGQEYLFSGFHDTDPLIWKLDVKHRGGLVSQWTSRYTRNLAGWIARRLLARNGKKI